MAHPLVKVNSVTISVPPHAGAEEGATTISSPVVRTSKCYINGEEWVIDGNQADWTCPICGASGKVTMVGNSKILVIGKVACITGEVPDVDHVGSYAGMDAVYDERVLIV